MVDCDEDGWVYSDHKWSNNEINKYDLMTENNTTKALTRRRRWYRKAVLIL